LFGSRSPGAPPVTANHMTPQQTPRPEPSLLRNRCMGRTKLITCELHHLSRTTPYPPSLRITQFPSCALFSPRLCNCNYPSSRVTDFRGDRRITVSPPFNNERPEGTQPSKLRAVIHSASSHLYLTTRHFSSPPASPRTVLLYLLYKLSKPRDYSPHTTT